METNEGKFKMFNAQNGASISLKQLDNGEVLEVNGVFQYDGVVDSYGKEQEATITVLFATDGQTYAGVSETVAAAGSKLIELFQATQMDAIRVAIIKQRSGKGNEFLNLRAVM
jgi:hypothetical protein